MNYADSDWSESKKAPSGSFRQLRKPTVLLFPPSNERRAAQPPTLFLATVGLPSNAQKNTFKDIYPGSRLSLLHARA